MPDDERVVADPRQVVALSSDGSTALIAGQRAGATPGVFLFTRSGSTWTQQGQAFTCNNGCGQAIALSANGDSALINDGGRHWAYGGTRLYTRSGSTWTQQGTKLSVRAYVYSDALSSDGSTVLIGSPRNKTSEVGTAWVFGTGPLVKKIKPKEGPATGGARVTITGNALTGATEVRFGSADASAFTVNSSKSITAVTPAGQGTVDVIVMTPEGTSRSSPADQFTYRPSS